MDSITTYLPIATCVTDDQLHIVQWNRILAQYSGVEPEAAIGRPLEELLPYTAQNHVRTRLLQTLQGGPPALFSARLHPEFLISTTRAGVTRRFETQAASFVASDGEQRLILTFTDQTEILNTLHRVSELRTQARTELDYRQRAEERLRRSEEILYTLFQAIPSPTFIWRKQADSLLLDECNDAARAAMHKQGLPSLQALLRQMEGPQPFIEAMVQSSFDCASPIIEERKTAGPADDETWHEFSFVPIPPNMVMVQVRDITARKRTEEARNTADRLHVANLMAATIAHEFNNPLAIIRTTVDLMGMRGTADEAAGKPLQTILRQVERMKGLTERLLRLQNLQEIDYAAGMHILSVYEDSEPSNEPASES